MGSITYDGTVVHFDDRVLTHLQIIIVQKFTKHESFLMSWKDGASVGDGRGSIWLSPNIPIYFKFVGGRVPNINEEWLVALGKSAESSTGLIVTGEDGELAASSPTNGDYPGMTSPARKSR
jgi:hypothetical protein